MKQEVKIGQTDYTVLILLRDKTTGAPKAAVLHDDAGMNVSYTRVATADNHCHLTDGGVPVTVAVDGAHTDWGFILVDDTHAPGLYRLDIADGVFASGAWSAVVTLVNTACDTVHIEFMLVPEAPVTGVNVSQWAATAVHTSDEAGTPCVEVVRWAGEDVAATGINGIPKVDVGAFLGHAITNTGTQIADAFQTMYDVASPVLTCQSVNQAQDNATTAEIKTALETGLTLATLSVTGQLDAGNVLVDGATVFTGNVSLADGLTIPAPSTAGRAGINITGKGAGQGVLITGGNTSASGVAVVGGSPNGIALYTQGVGSGEGIRIDGGDGDGSGIEINAGATNSNGITITGNGTGHGVSVIGGDGATGNGMNVIANSTNGFGVSITGVGSGDGLSTVGGLTGSGIKGTGGGTSGHGVYAKAAGTGHGIAAHGGGVAGDGLHAEADNDGDGIEATKAGATNFDIHADEIANIQSSVSGIGTAGGAAINVDAHDDNVNGDITDCTIAAINAEAFVGVQGVGAGLGDFTKTSILDGTIQQITHDTNVIDIIYLFKTGGGTTPIGVVWTGRLNQSGDSCLIQAWDHVGAAWETVGTIDGQNNLTTNIVKNMILYTRHKGTSATELGHVYVRFLSSSTVSLQILKTDQIYVSYSVTSRSVGYADGAVWVNTATGATGTESYVYGTADNPVKTIAEALTIAAAVGLTTINIASGSSITLAASVAGKNLIGKYWTLALGGQDIAGAFFEGATVSGVSSGVDAWFRFCEIGTATIAQAYFTTCIFNGTLTTVTGGNYVLMSCYDGIPGTVNPVFVLTANTNMGVRQWSGGVQFNTIVATNTIAIDGKGRLVLHTDCHETGTVIVRGAFSITDNATGGFEATGGTLTQSERLTNTELIEDILRNKMEVTDATGAVTLYNDAGAALYTVAGCVTDDLTTTTRLRLA
jgi:hypothetical protein